MTSQLDRLLSTGHRDGLYCRYTTTILERVTFLEPGTEIHSPRASKASDRTMGRIGFFFFFFRTLRASAVLTTAGGWLPDSVQRLCISHSRPPPIISSAKFFEYPQTSISASRATFHQILQRYVIATGRCPRVIQSDSSSASAGAKLKCVHSPSRLYF
jgi:hypothetical protein